MYPAPDILSHGPEKNACILIKSHNFFIIKDILSDMMTVKIVYNLINACFQTKILLKVEIALL